MLTAAKASLPTPRPKKAPSAMFSREVNSMPNSVGMKSFTKSLDMSVLAKSMESLFMRGVWGRVLMGLMGLMG